LCEAVSPCDELSCVGRVCVSIRLPLFPLGWQVLEVGTLYVGVRPMSAARDVLDFEVMASDVFEDACDRLASEFSGFSDRDPSDHHRRPSASVLGPNVQAQYIDVQHCANRDILARKAQGGVHFCDAILQAVSEIVRSPKAQSMHRCAFESFFRLTPVQCRPLREVECAIRSWSALQRLDIFHLLRVRLYPFRITCHCSLEGCQLLSHSAPYAAFHWRDLALVSEVGKTCTHLILRHF
jgi:hypothetical protein